MDADAQSTMLSPVSRHPATNCWELQDVYLVPYFWSLQSDRTINNALQVMDFDETKPSDEFIGINGNSLDRRIVDSQDQTRMGSLGVWKSHGFAIPSFNHLGFSGGRILTCRPLLKSLQPFD